jgi:hypothetical protein
MDVGVNTNTIHLAENYTSENSDGFWRILRFRRYIYYNSDGRWAKSKYDSEGNRIYFENSRGVIIDDRPKEE